TFRSEPLTIRGQEFSRCVVDIASDGSDSNSNTTLPLGFTTDLGKNWTIENAYRELFCNCLDEFPADSRPPLSEVGTLANSFPSPSTDPSTPETSVAVSGAASLTAHRNRGAFILDTDTENLLF